MKKYIIPCLVLFLHQAVLAQKHNWQNMDLAKDSVFGISTERAYSELLKGKKPKPVIVAVVDSGVDTTHEDLKGVLWTDPKTGIHGWNYISTETGKEDIVNLVGIKKEFYDSLSNAIVPEAYRAGYQKYRKLLPQLNGKIKKMEETIKVLKAAELITDSIILKIGKKEPGIADFKSYKPHNSDDSLVVSWIIDRMPHYRSWKQCRQAEITSIISLARYHLSHGLNIGNEESDTAIGDADISPDALGFVDQPNMTVYHGTHVAGIIGAVRNNGIGINGIADNVQIMMLKTVGNIRELRDKDLAKAIRFAVDNGVKVINMSFGKPYSWDKKDVDDAVKYAMKHDVLIVHAAGNNAEDLDLTEHYPNPVYADGSGQASAWIEVGASRPYNDTVLMVAFSNRGKRSVDVFAPGAGIYSTVPFSKYEKYSGTSMAAPVVTGLAALIREYYPKLTAIQVRDIIVNSVVKVNHKVYITETRAVPFSDLCVSGGIVNAYNALKLAATYK